MMRNWSYTDGQSAAITAQGQVHLTSSREDDSPASVTLDAVYAVGSRLIETVSPVRGAAIDGMAGMQF